MRETVKHALECLGTWQREERHPYCRPSVYKNARIVATGPGGSAVSAEPVIQPRAKGSHPWGRS